MKLSILTATYNRGSFLTRLYESIINNLIDEMDIEWLIIDDGSVDNTTEIVSNFVEKEKLKIQYFKQENQGKMQAINNLIKYITGEICIEFDSDDYFTNDAFKRIYEKYSIIKENPNIYALIFLKNECPGRLSGKKFINENVDTTAFDLYFKDDIGGEKNFIYNSNIRKQYKYIIEPGEKFCTEARLHHQLDLKYKIRCFNEVIAEGEYQENGYTKNMQKIFKENPVGFRNYFFEILLRNMKGIKFKKRIYIIKHYILFSVLSNMKINIREIKGIYNKILIMILYFPGKIKSKIYKANK